MGIRMFSVGAAVCGLLGGWAVDRSNPLPTFVESADDADFVYLAGILGRAPGGDEFPEGVDAQARQALDNLGAALRAEGLDYTRVVSVNVFLPDTRLFSAMNEVYRTYFSENPPTRATVQADLPIPEAQIQIAAVAAKAHVALRVITPAGMQRPGLPYSWGILADNTLFVAGTTSRDLRTYEPVPGDAAAQTRRVLGNIGSVLEAAEMSYGAVVSCKVFLSDARDFRAMNREYASFFIETPPARATVRAPLMNPLFRSEIQCIAVRDAGRRVVRAEGARPSRAPLSPAIHAGDRLYLSGMLGRGPDGYSSDVADQTRQALGNLRATLRAAGMDLENVVESMVFVPDVRRAGAVREVYDEVMPAGSPVPTVVGAGLMTTAGMVEIQMVAVP